MSAVEHPRPKCGHTPGHESGECVPWVILKTLGDDHDCLHHNGPNTGPCRTCKRRAAKLMVALAAEEAACSGKATPAAHGYDCTCGREAGK